MSNLLAARAQMGISLAFHMPTTRCFFTTTIAGIPRACNS